MAGAARSRKDVGRSGGVVAERHRGVIANEDRTGVANAPRGHGSIPGLDLEVFRGVRVGHCDCLIEVADEHDGRLLACQGGADSILM